MRPPPMAISPVALLPLIAMTPTAFTPPIATTPTALTALIATRPTAFAPPNTTNPKAFRMLTAARPIAVQATRSSETDGVLSTGCHGADRGVPLVDRVHGIPPSGPGLSPLRRSWRATPRCRRDLSEAPQQRGAAGTSLPSGRLGLSGADHDVSAMFNDRSANVILLSRLVTGLETRPPRGARSLLPGGRGSRGCAP